jgi:hypothetical protein
MELTADQQREALMRSEARETRRQQSQKAIAETTKIKEKTSLYESWSTHYLKNTQVVNDHATNSYK